jgi:hypothetical protein
MSWWSCLVVVVKDWQTLISALLALGAAWWTIQTIKGQISAEAQRHIQTSTRKALAARAQMPDALSQLCRFTEGCMSFLDGRNEGLPDKATDAINILKSTIEFIDTQPAGKVFELVSFYQVHNARLYSGREHRSPEIADRMYDTALLRFYVDRLYDYARNETEVVAEGESIPEIVSALKQAVTLTEFVGNQQRYESALRKIARHKIPRSAD